MIANNHFDQTGGFGEIPFDVWLDCAQYADRQPRTGEWMPHENLFRQTQLTADLTNLVFVKLRKRLDDSTLDRSERGRRRASINAISIITRTIFFNTMLVFPFTSRLGERKE